MPVEKWDLTRGLKASSPSVGTALVQSTNPYRVILIARNFEIQKKNVPSTAVRCAPFLKQLTCHPKHAQRSTAMVDLWEIVKQEAADL